MRVSSFSRRFFLKMALICHCYLWVGGTWLFSSSSFAKKDSKSQLLYKKGDGQIGPNFRRKILNSDHVKDVRLTLVIFDYEICKFYIFPWESPKDVGFPRGKKARNDTKKGRKLHEFKWSPNETSTADAKTAWPQSFETFVQDLDKDQKQNRPF